MKKVLVIQARTTSTRLPNKVLLTLCGQPMLAQQIRRLKYCNWVDEIMIATTANQTDDPIVEIAKTEGVSCFRGDEEDVLRRFVEAARVAQADVIIRSTADCPLIDPEIVDRVIRELIDHASACDYASNVLQRTYPRGLDVEAMFWDTLLRIDRLAQSKPAREHVTVVPRSEQPSLFLCRNVADQVDNSDLRWTVDTAADFQLICRLFEALQIDQGLVSYREILSYVRANPEIGQANLGGNTWDPSIHLA